MSAVDVLKSVGGPGSIGLLAAGCVAGLFLIYVWPSRRVLGRVWLLGLYVAHIVVGVPVVAQRIAEPLVSPASRSPEELGRIDTLIVLAGDNPDGRAAAAMRAWLAATPSRVIVSGERRFLDLLTARGMPAARIRHEAVSANTREQIAYVQAYVEAHPDARVALIASRFQMPRVAALLCDAGVRLHLLASPADAEPDANGIGRFIPTYAALSVSRDALYERAALAYYRSRGWIRADPATARSCTS